jgi:neopullulanase
MQWIKRRIPCCSVFLALALAACTDDAPEQQPKGFGGGSGSGGFGGAGGSGVLCPVTFRYQTPAGLAVGSLALAGEWNDFDPEHTLFEGPDASGAFSVSIELEPGFWGYKLVLNGSEWSLDPGRGYRKYVGGQENSGIRVADCRVPGLTARSSNAARPSAGAGTFTATVDWQAALSGAKLDPASASGTLRRGSSEEPVATGISADAEAGTISVALEGLADGKYTLVLSASDSQGTAARPARLVFWIEAEAFDWRDAVIYMIVTDRYKDGDPSNNAPPTAGVQDDRGDWKGGDLEGIRQKIADGTLDALGVRALWLTPFQTNPAGAYLASDNYHNVTGYHGYWPIQAREVDPRLGGEAALRALVAEAHAHGIRILMDYVVNHVHEEHEYVKQHPRWFRTGCVCGTDGCDWTGKALECLFTPYLPDIDWTVPEAGEQIVDDAIWWLDSFDLDGLRVDAVKHVEDAAITNLSTRVREEFEAAGTKYFLMGETAMGWGDCDVGCNAENYGTISRYIGPFALDGQFDFVLYHGVSYRVFAHDDKGMLHADFWTQASQTQFPAGSIMTPFIGSHDSPRFVTLATYRGQPGFDPGVPGRQWDDVAGPPVDSEPYARHASGLSWLLGLPGAPLLYYGDEYGEWGGADPGNRAMWRGDSASLNADERALLERTRKLGAARKELVALRRGGYRSLHATETFLAFARETSDGKAAIVAVSRDGAPLTVEVTLPPSLPLASGTKLADRLGGAGATVTNGKISVQLPARGAAILAP